MTKPNIIVTLYILLPETDYMPLPPRPVERPDSCTLRSKTHRVSLLHRIGGGTFCPYILLITTDFPLPISAFARSSVLLSLMKFILVVN